MPKSETALKTIVFTTDLFIKRNILYRFSWHLHNATQIDRHCIRGNPGGVSCSGRFTYVVVRWTSANSSSFGSPFAMLLMSPQARYSVDTLDWKKAEMSSRKKQRLSIRTEDDFVVVSLEDMEIWDGADLALLREALTNLIEQAARHVAT